MINPPDASLPDEPNRPEQQWVIQLSTSDEPIIVTASTIKEAFRKIPENNRSNIYSIKPHEL
jgi:hypothetical protein